MPRFRDHNRFSWKGLVGEQRTKEERVDDQSADGLGRGWDMASTGLQGALGLQCKQRLAGQPPIPSWNWSSAELVHEEPFKSVSWRWVAWPSRPCSFRLHAILEPPDSMKPSHLLQSFCVFLSQEHWMPTFLWSIFSPCCFPIIPLTSISNHIPWSLALQRCTALVPKRTTSKKLLCVAV